MNSFLGGVMTSAAVLLVLALCGVFLFSCGTPVKGVAYNAAAPTFPSVQGDNLNFRPMQIPSGLDAQYNIVMVAFKQWQQRDVNTWLPLAKELSGEHANVEFYELPTISARWGIARGWVDGGMRSGIPDISARERTITIYTDTEKFRELAGIEDPNQIWTGIVDREGKVYWTRRGPATQEALAELRAFVRTLANPTFK
jgi:hypothetical protein